MQTSVQQFIRQDHVRPTGGSNLGVFGTRRPQRLGRIINNGSTINWFMLAAGVLHRLVVAPWCSVQQQTGGIWTGASGWMKGCDPRLDLWG